MRPLAFVGEKVFQASEQEGTKLPGGRLHVPEGVSFKETKKEFLREILGFMRTRALSPDKGIERIPIRRAQTGQGLARICAVLLASRQDHGPVRRVKAPGRCRRVI